MESFFFFQAEDGIRDLTVTGVQTCALPILSRECGLLTSAEAGRIVRLLERAGLPTRIASVTPAAALEHMRIDKKVLGGRLRLVLLRGIGTAYLTADYPPAALERTLAAHCG